MAAAVAVPVLVASTLVALVALNDGEAPAPATTTTSTTIAAASPEAQAFLERADEAFKPLADAVTTFLPQAQEFEGGTMAASEFKAALDVARPEFLKSRDAVAGLEEYGPAPAVNRYFLVAAQLYLEMARVYGVAVDPGVDTLRAQLNLAARRLRTLGDRIYDRARAILEPGLYADPGPDVEIRPPTEVPDWEAEGMAAGPPLADAPGPAAEPPPVREPTCGDGVAPPCREEEPVEGWVGRVMATDLPQAPEVVEALDAVDRARLRELADRYDAVTRTLRAGPDPDGDRERAAVLGLGLLTGGEAARVGQAAALLPEGNSRGRLLAVARRVLAVGDDLRETVLGLRPSGLVPPGPDDTGP